MGSKVLLVVTTAAMVITSIGAQADEPHQAQVGDKQVTSVTRSETRGAALSRSELLDAARTAIPLNVMPANPSENGVPGNTPKGDNR